MRTHLVDLRNMARVSQDLRAGKKDDDPGEEDFMSISISSKLTFPFYQYP